MNNNKKRNNNKAGRSGRNPISYSISAGTARYGMKTERGADTFVSTVTGTAAFTSNIYEINPGISARNLALSKEAQKYDQYRFKRLRFRYVPSVAVTTTAGLIGIAVDPNANSSAPDELTRFNAYEIRKMGSVYDEILLEVPHSALSLWKWTRCGPLGTDLINYDVGTLVVAAQDMAATGKVGLVEIHYEVEFRHYHLEPVAPIPKSLAIINLNKTQSVVSGTEETIQFNESVIDGIGVSNDMDNWELTLPCGQYIIRCEVNGEDSGVTESFSLDFDLQKNDANLDPRVRSKVVATVSNPGFLYGAATGYVVSDGSDTFRVVVTLTGATGTLTLPIDQSRIVIQALT